MFTKIYAAIKILTSLVYKKYELKQCLITSLILVLILSDFLTNINIVRIISNWQSEMKTQAIQFRFTLRVHGTAPGGKISTKYSHNEGFSSALPNSRVISHVSLEN